MIIPLKNGGQVIVGECPWLPRGGVYLAIGNMCGSQGTILNPAELDQVRVELDRVAGQIAERAAAKSQRKQRKAA